MRYSVSYEVRQCGAIGTFDWATFTVEAASEQQARDIVFNDLHERGFETRGGPIIEERGQ